MRCGVRAAGRARGEVGAGADGDRILALALHSGGCPASSLCGPSPHSPWILLPPSVPTWLLVCPIPPSTSLPYELCVFCSWTGAPGRGAAVNAPACIKGRSVCPRPAQCGFLPHLMKSQNVTSSLPQSCLGAPSSQFND